MDINVLFCIFKHIHNTVIIEILQLTVKCRCAIVNNKSILTIGQHWVRTLDRIWIVLLCCFQWFVSNLHLIFLLLTVVVLTGSVSPTTIYIHVIFINKVIVPVLRSRMIFQHHLYPEGWNWLSFSFIMLLCSRWYLFMNFSFVALGSCSLFLLFSLMFENLYPLGSSPFSFILINYILWFCPVLLVQCILSFSPLCHIYISLFGLVLYSWLLLFM